MRTNERGLIINDIFNEWEEVNYLNTLRRDLDKKLLIWRIAEFLDSVDFFSDRLLGIRKLSTAAYYRDVKIKSYAENKLYVIS